MSTMEERFAEANARRGLAGVDAVNRWAPPLATLAAAPTAARLQAGWEATLAALDHPEGRQVVGVFFDVIVQEVAEKIARGDDVHPVVEAQLGTALARHGLADAEAWRREMDACAPAFMTVFRTLDAGPPPLDRLRAMWEAALAALELAEGRRLLRVLSDGYLGMMAETLSRAGASDEGAETLEREMPEMAEGLALWRAEKRHQEEAVVACAAARSVKETPRPRWVRGSRRLAELARRRTSAY